MKLIPLIIVISVSHLITQAQSISKQVLGSSGAHISNGTYNLNFTVGETIVGDIENTEKVSQGFWAELSNGEVLHLQEFDNPIQSVSVYPNPVANYLHIRFKEQFSEDYIYQLFDIGGKQILDLKRINEGFNVSKLDVSGLSEGTYMLLIADKNSNYNQSFKIVKN
ncbi:MAG: T9SS type A sorting domain-containing protein [Bacteroidota bacterium]